MGKLSQTWIALAVLTCVAGTTGAVEVVDPKVGYSFTLPDGWQRVPDEALARVLSITMRPGAQAPRFVAAYEPSEHRSHLQYPYLLVQVQSYGKGLDLATISRRELDDMVVKLTGVPASRLKQNLTADAAKAVSGLSFEAPMVFTDPPGITVETTMKVAGVGSVHSRTIGRLGQTNAVFLHFYAKDRGWMAHWDLLDKLDTSFRRTPDQAITVADATRTSSGNELSPGGGFDWGRVGGKAIFGGMAGAIAGAFALFARGRKTVSGGDGRPQ